MLKKNQNNQQLFLSLVGIFIVFVISSLFYLIDETISNDQDAISDMKILEENTNFRKKESNYNNLDLDINNNYLSEIKDLHDSLKDDEPFQITETITPKVKIVPKEVSEKRTDIIERKKIYKLAIIIDDVAFQYQVKRLRKLNLPITFSFFPADINHPQTSNYAKRELVPMVHFPLEAINFKNEEIQTLHVGDSYEKIENRVKQILIQFPNLKFTNNHTGSKFTSDYSSMKKLLTVLKKNNIQFVDSVTTSKSQVRKISKELGTRYIRRNIFIDNKLNVPYIVGQLKKAIAKARKNGFAIAIGHPHKATLKALSKIKPLLGDVRLVFINDI